MQWANSKARYGAGPLALHWLTAVFVIAGWLLGQFGDVFPKGPARDFGLWTHMTLGQLVIVLLIARLAWRIADPPPSPEATRFGRPLHIAAKLSHFALYALLVVVPFVGIIVQLKRGHALPVLGLFDVSSPWPADRAVARNVLRAHEYLANALLLLASLHSVVAIFHHWVLGDRTLVRMLPGAT
jgi:cytochrome b561